MLANAFRIGLEKSHQILGSGRADDSGRRLWQED
jgi:hypothetical protein